MSASSSRTDFLFWDMPKGAAQVVTRTKTDAALLLALSAARDGSLSWARNFRADLRVKAAKGGFLIAALNEPARPPYSRRPPARRGRARNQNDFGIP